MCAVVVHAPSYALPSCALPFLCTPLLVHSPSCVLPSPFVLVDQDALEAWLTARRSRSGLGDPALLPSQLPGSGDDAAGVRIVTLSTPLPLRLAPSERHTARAYQADLAAWGFTIVHTASGE